MNRRILFKIVCNPRTILLIFSLIMLLFSQKILADGDDPGQGVTDPDPLG